jgi:glycosyltransferase involved in cell wall biosynthesis
LNLPISPNASVSRIGFVSRLGGIAGPAAFQRRLSAGLSRRGIEISYSLADKPYEAVIVIGASRRLGTLTRARRRGIRIVQRLNGMNWLHRQIRTGLRHFLRAEVNNLLLRVVRDRLADHVVYQSEFAQGWWERVHGPTIAPSSVVYNGVPLERYTPDGAETRPTEHIRLLMVEGNFAGGYELGLESGLELARAIADRSGRSIELTVAGQAPVDIENTHPGVRVDRRGEIEPGQIPALDRSAHALFSGDLNPACPNAVIEAMACGLPVLAYETGALAELVQGEAGRLARYGGDPWKATPPAVGGLAEASLEVLEDQSRFRAGARARAEARFGEDQMVDGYLAALAAS